MTTLAIDLGTSAVKLLRADATLRILSADRVPQATIDVDAWIDCLRQNIQAHGDGGAIERIAITGQMHGLVTLEDDGYGQGIPWTDQRGTDVLPDLLGNLDPAHITRIGGSLASGFQAVSLAWMRVYEPGRWTRIRQVMSPKDALIHALTGAHVTDPSDAAGTGMLDIKSRDWSDEMLDAIGIPHAWLPRIVPSGSEIGTIRPQLAPSLGLRRGTPVIIAGGDAAVGAAGAGVTRAGDALVLLSSGAQVLLPSPEYDPDPAGRWYTWPAAVPGGAGFAPYLRAGTLLNAGSTVSWLRDILYDREGIAPEPTRLIALPHLIGARDEPLARGAILGLRPGTTGAEIRRAMLEGVAFGLRRVLEMMTGGDMPARVLLGGGGAAIEAWPGIIANVLGIPVARIATTELSARGAAALASGTPSMPDIDREIVPDARVTRRYHAQFAMYGEALEAARTLDRGLAALED